MKLATCLASLVAVAAWSSGCAEDLESRQFQTRLVSADADTVLQAAEVALRREFPRVTVDRAAGRITSEPLEYTTATESGTSRDLVRGASSMRRVAACSVSPRGERAVLRLRIDVQRQDTARRDVVQPEQGRISDTPGYTPIDRDSATTREQNAVWTFVRRDRQLERALLEEIQGLFADDAEKPTSSQPQSQEASAADNQDRAPADPP